MSENRLSVSNLTMPSWKWTQVSAIGWCCLETDAYVLNQMLPTENRRNYIGSDGTFLKRTYVSKLVWYHPIKDANVQNQMLVSENGRYRLKAEAVVSWNGVECPKWKVPSEN